MKTREIRRKREHASEQASTKVRELISEFVGEFSMTIDFDVRKQKYEEMRSKWTSYYIKNSKGVVNLSPNAIETVMWRLLNDRPDMFDDVTHTSLKNFMKKIGHKPSRKNGALFYMADENI